MFHNIVYIDSVYSCSLYICNVSCRKNYVLIITSSYDKSFFCFKVCKNLLHFFCLNFCKCKAVYNNQFIILNFGSQSGFQSCSSFFFVHFYFIISRYRSEYYTAASPLWCTDGTLSSMTCSFLSPRFSSAAAYFRTCFCFLSTLAIICKLTNNSKMNKMLVDFYSEHCIVQFHCSNFIAFHIINCYVCHSDAPPFSL